MLLQHFPSLRGLEFCAAILHAPIKRGYDAITQLGDVRAIDQASHHVHTAAGGPAEGLAIWTEPGPGGEPHLGDVYLPSDDRQLFYQLIKACARDALTRGYEHASFTVRDTRLLSLIQRDFTVEAKPSAWDAGTGAPARWEIRVELEDALQQLRGVLDA